MTYKFIKYTKVWFAISGLAILIGIGAMISNKLNIGSSLVYGIDFTGGSIMEFEFEKGLNPATDELFAAIDEAYPQSVSQITMTDQNTYIVQSRDMSEEQLQAVRGSVTSAIGGYELLRFNTIGPKIGDTLKRKAVIALGIATVAIVLYIAYAFRKVPKKVSPWRFGFAAILALIHDILITLGVFALLRFEVNVFFITALLTVMGFSVHDTIVVFDRIRENLKKQGRDDTFGDIADISLNQTMSRSINTSLSTLFPLVALFLWGADAIRLFIFALIVGIIVGTYSSIFIASPILAMWQESKRLR
ncbi:protein translocase subunit SecF [Patescibacteria group bacterium]|nr:protein translocase subunit SecF [Patescibacteria group bacterium]MBU1015580.1 protein translocase subunit SecF [Patescibacteria group bacterium]MBU1684728.1 protein translocase subunit SecF [Patescibacteria group bacterium]MBU1938283.1 protein translocase subunit SecF [Patescibacteria group bacterium]